ncbi:MAG: HEPN domain-containing protein [Candidatus Nealsonbacteria bacterium]
MPFSSWDDFLALAKTLVDLSGESMFRSAINRSYYSAFHISIQFAQATYSFQRDRSSSDHGRVVSQLRRSGDRPIQDAGRQLNRLRDNRRKADYDERIQITGSFARASIQIAERIIDILRNWTPAP